MKKTNSISLSILVTVVFSFCLGTASYAKEPKKVAILPFKMNADRDLTFLQEGIMDMLGSRLAWKDEVSIMDKKEVKGRVSEIKGPLDPDKALILGKRLKADYVILGSLTVFGESVSMDAKIFDVAKGEQLMTSFTQSKGMDEVIPTINRFARDINAKIMGRVVKRPVYVTEAGEESGGGALIRVRKKLKGPERAAHVQKFKMEIVGMDVGDVDGDGKNELAFIENDTLYVYTWRNGTFERFREIKGGWSPDFIYLSMADLDGNGRSEIYISNLTATNVSSKVYEWQAGGKLKKIADRQPWLFRVIEIPGKGETLIGEKRVPDGGFRGTVKILQREGSDFKAFEDLELPDGGNVFNFAYLPVPESQNRLTIMLDPYEYLRVYDDIEEEELWKSSEHFGGTFTAIPSKDRIAGTLPAPDIMFFIASPISLVDVNEDGHREVVICQNESKSLRMTPVYREFSTGKVHFMAWDGIGLSTHWTSQKLNGAVVGYKIADVDHDGLPELVTAVVTKSGFSVGQSKSQIVMYDLK